MRYRQREGHQLLPPQIDEMVRDLSLNWAKAEEVRYMYRTTPGRVSVSLQNMTLIVSEGEMAMLCGPFVVRSEEDAKRLRKVLTDAKERAHNVLRSWESLPPEGVRQAR